MKHLLLAISLVLAMVSSAAALQLQETAKMTIKDAQFYLRPFKGNNAMAKAAAGVCYGSLYTLRKQNGTPVADIFSVCGVASSRVKGQAEFSGGIGIMPFSIMGLQTTIMYDPIDGEMVWGLGFSLTGIMDQLLK